MPGAGIAEYIGRQGDFEVTDDMQKDFSEHGFLMVRGLFSKEEVKRIETTVSNEEFMKHTYGAADGEGKEAHYVLWLYPGDDVAGLVARCEKVAGTCEKILGGGVPLSH